MKYINKVIKCVALFAFVVVDLNAITLPHANNAIAQDVLFSAENLVANSALVQDGQIKKKDDKNTAEKAQAIDFYFKKYDMPLSGFGVKMVEEAEKNKIDWRLLPAIAMRESTGGKYACKKVSHNAFGWASCKIGFNSIEESIEIIAKNLGGNNPNTAKYYADKDIKGILEAYNPPYVVPNYADQVMQIMEKIGE